MTDRERLVEMEKATKLARDASPTMENVWWTIDWLIARVRKLEAELQALVDYQFAVNDKTGALVKQHCKNAIEESDEGEK